MHRKRVIFLALVILAVIIFYFLNLQLPKYETGHPSGLYPSFQMTNEKLQTNSTVTIQNSTKWIILNGYSLSLAYLCSRAFEKFPDWDIAVVTEDRTVVYVCRTGITKLVSDLSYGYPTNELTRTPLLAACLLAIQEGAEAIYLPSRTWMSSSGESIGVKLGNSSTGLISQKYANRFASPGCQLAFFATRRHFGCSKAEYVEDAKPLYDLCEHELPGIQAPIVIQRSKQDIEDDHPMCDPRAPPVAIPEHVYVDDLQIEAALYAKRAFWALIFPALIEESLIPKRTIPFVRILIQKVLWSTGTNVMVWHNGYEHKVKKSVNIDQLSARDKALLNDLEYLHCPKFKVRSCLMDAMTNFSRGSFSGLINAVSGWVDMLEFMKATPQASAKKVKFISRHVTFHPVDYSERWFGKTTQSKVPYVPITNVKLITEQFKQTCDESKIPKDVKVNLTHPWEQFTDILLLIIFNKVHYEVIPLIETLYRPFFPNIIYCGPGQPNTTLEQQLSNYKYSFVSYHMTQRISVLTGLCNYECATMALSMSYNVVGYAIMGDDVLISLPKINKRPRDNAWFNEKILVRYFDTDKQVSCGNDTCISHVDWFWWKYYRHASAAITKTLQNGQTNDVYRRCYRRLVSLTGVLNPIFHSISDFFYVPKRLASDFVELAWLFRQYGMFLELTVPTILNCIEDPTRLEQMSASYILIAERDQPWLFFDESFQDKVILHPTKWGPLLTNSVGHVLFYCYQVLPYLHDPLARVR